MEGYFRSGGSQVPPCPSRKPGDSRPRALQHHCYVSRVPPPSIGTTSNVRWVIFPPPLRNKHDQRWGSGVTKRATAEARCLAVAPMTRLATDQSRSPEDQVTRSSSGSGEVHVVVLDR